MSVHNTQTLSRTSTVARTCTPTGTDPGISKWRASIKVGPFCPGTQVTVADTF